MSLFKDSHEPLPPLQHLQWLPLLKFGVHILRFKILHNIVQAQTPVPTGLMCLALCSVAQSCLILCCPLDCSLPGSSTHGILQARILSVLPFPSPYVATKMDTDICTHGGGREAQEGGDTGILCVDPRCCTAETNNAIKQLSSN